MKYYIATKLERAKDHSKVASAMNARGHQLTYDWTTHGPVWAAGKERISKVAGREREGVTAAELLIALLPGGRGTHVEIGIAIGAGCPVLLHASKEDAARMFEATPDCCAFYLLGPPRVYVTSRPYDELPIVAEFIRGIEFYRGSSQYRDSLFELGCQLHKVLEGESPTVPKMPPEDPSHG